ncbi:sulfatase-like hydrolase/transferase, partial [Planctomycetota bacterium]
MNTYTTICWRYSRWWLLGVVASMGCLIGPTLSTASGATQGKPNILFIFADDQCHETIHALGHAEVKTPNLDRLAQSGLTFTNAYNMGSWTGAVCVASRTMLNTGRFVWRAHNANLAEIMNREQSWSQLLRN